MEPITVLLVDDHKILRDGIRTLLNREVDIEVIGEAEDGHSAIKLAHQLLPSVIILDIAMPLLNGLEVACQLHRDLPNIKIIILSMHDNEEYIRQALSFGALGYILKDASVSELIDAIRKVNRGEAVLSPAITNLVITDYLRWGDFEPDDAIKGLSSREREILQLIAEGYINKQIAKILCISIKTVQTHRLNLMRKLDLHDRGELIKFAIQKKIIDV
jgi:DNA-binding NarL/FixJ family response regulator